MWVTVFIDRNAAPESASTETEIVSRLFPTCAWKRGARGCERAAPSHIFISSTSRKMSAPRALTLSAEVFHPPTVTMCVFISAAVLPAHVCLCGCVWERGGEKGGGGDWGTELWPALLYNLSQYVAFNVSRALHQAIFLVCPLWFCFVFFFFFYTFL